MKNSLITTVKKINDKLCVELPGKVVAKLAINEDQNIEFGCSNNITIWKSGNIDVPNDVFEQLMVMFTTENFVFQWINKKQKYLLGRIPITMLNTSKGKEEVIGLIERLQRGDFS
ncbi:MAG: antitoxin component of MazEF toxin-antitoxin module [Colwellia sp.]|jgi:antitoxin component of MazEF toxin-antitoxin module